VAALLPRFASSSRLVGDAGSDATVTVKGVAHTVHFTNGV